ncbi:MAG TPA: metallophosphoesterase [Phycisphaerae bacterium]|nr:metallophosphoesterase [Phycisphaerae bacterium]
MTQLQNRENDWEFNPHDAHSGIGQMVDRMDRAAILMRRDPLRRGNIVRLPEKGDVVILGDLHGDRGNFDRVVEWSAMHLHKDRYLVLQELIHGGPSESLGGDQSFRLLEEAAALKCRYKSRVQVVLSNHDVCEILGSTIMKAGRNVSSPFWKGIESAYGAAWPEVHGAYRRFLSALPLAVRTPTGVLISHSTPQKDALEHFDYTIFERALTMDDYLPGGSVYALVWGRYHDQQAADEFARSVDAEILVTGHQTAMPGIKTPTSRHIILTSDGPLGRFLNLRLNVHAPYSVVLRQATKVRSLT